MDIINKHDEQTNDLVWSKYSTKLNAYKKILIIDNLEARKLFIETIKSCKF